MQNIPLDLIQNLNLSENEGRVYFAALELGQSTIQDIARKSGVKRTSIYNFIDGMKARGFITQTRKKDREYFSALHPKQLMAKEQLKIAQLDRLLPELMSIANRQRGRPRIQFFEGIEGIRLVHTYELAAKNEIVGWCDFNASVKLLGDDFYYDYFIPGRVRRGIWYRGIIDDTPVSRRYISRNNKDMRETKTLPVKGEILTETDIFNDSVVFMSFGAKPPVAVLIEDRAIATTMRLIWTAAWNTI